jgi:hypothetical protein
LRMEWETLSLAGGVKHQNSSFDAAKNLFDWREHLGALRMEWETLSLAGGVKHQNSSFDAAKNLFDWRGSHPCWFVLCCGS